MRNNKGQFINGVKNPWTEEHRLNHKLAFQKYKAESHWNWKGDKVGYSALHEWLYKNYGKPLSCEQCESKNNLVWANKTGEYLRERNDWLWLCESCHKTYDGIINNIEKMRA